MGTGLVNQDALRVLARIELARRQARGIEVVQKLPEKLRTWRGFSDFCEAQLKIKPKEQDVEAGESGLIPFRLRWIQRQILAAEIRARRAKKKPHFLILKFRKGGVTTLQQALSYWTCWANRHRECLTIAHEVDSTRIIFRMVTRFYDAQPAEFRHPKTSANVNHIEFPDWGSLYMAGTAGKGGGKGRGATFSRLHLSEAAHYPDLSGLMGGMSESIGDTSAYILETTPNGREGKGQRFFELWDAATKGKNDFVPLFFPWHSDPLNRLPLFEPDEIDHDLDLEALEIMNTHRLDKEQMKWWLEKRRRLNASGAGAALIMQEHPSDAESAFLWGTDGYYDRTLCINAAKRCAPPIAVEDNGRLRIWEIPDKRNPATYVIGADPSGGVGGDDCAAVIFNVKTGAQAATYKFNRIPPDDFGRFTLNELGKRWANPVTGVPAYIVVEANNHGHATLTGLLKMAGYPKDRVYHQTDEARVDEWGNLKMGDRPGWTNNITTHADLTAVVGRMLREASPLIRDDEVVQHIRRVGVSPTGAEFTGRDLAVAAGLAAIGFPFARETQGDTKAYIGGRVVDF